MAARSMSARSLLSAGGASSREKILDVAEAAFALRGFDGVGLRELSERAGLGKSSLFHHFKTKAHIYFAVLARVLDRLDSHLQPAVASPAEPADAVGRWVDALIDALAEHPSTARLLLRGLFEDQQPFAEEVGPELEAVEQGLMGLVRRFEELVRAGVASGDFRSVSVHDLTQTVIGATVYHFASGAFGEDVMGGPIYSAEAVARRRREVKSLLQRGLMPEQETPPV